MQNCPEQLRSAKLEPGLAEVGAAPQEKMGCEAAEALAEHPPGAEASGGQSHCASRGFLEPRSVLVAEACAARRALAAAGWHAWELVAPKRPARDGARFGVRSTWC